MELLVLIKFAYFWWRNFSKFLIDFSTELYICRYELESHILVVSHEWNSLIELVECVWLLAKVRQVPQWPSGRDLQLSYKRLLWGLGFESHRIRLVLLNFTHLAIKGRDKILQWFINQLNRLNSNKVMQFYKLLLIIW